MSERRKAAKAFLNHASLRYPEDVELEAVPSATRFFTVDGVFEALENFAEWLPRTLRDDHSGLDNLELGYRGLADLGAVALGSALELNNTLVTVNLSGNGIGEDGARALGRGLSGNEWRLRVGAWAGSVRACHSKVRRGAQVLADTNAERFGSRAFALPRLFEG